jgi:hypothetical protein
MIDQFQEIFTAEGDPAPRVTPKVRAEVLAMIDRIEEQRSSCD